MNVSEQIIQVIDNLAQKFGVAIDWSSENIIPIIQQLSDKYIQFEINSSVFFICLAILGFVLCLIGYIALLINREALGLKVEDVVGFTILLALIFVFLCIPISIQIIDIIKCNTIPELVIIDFVKGLTGK